MSLKRSILVALATMFVAIAAPAAHAQVGYGFGPTGCGGGCGAVAYAPILYAQPIAPAPVYMVDQGPDFTGPGIMEPYRTYAPPAQYAPPPGYPPYGYGNHAAYHHH